MGDQSCRHGLTTHCALCMHEGKGARPAAEIPNETQRLQRELAELSVNYQEALIKLETAKDKAAENLENGLDAESECMRLRQQLAESERQRESLKAQGDYLQDKWGACHEELQKTKSETATLTAQLAQYQQAEPVYQFRYDGWKESRWVECSKEDYENPDSLCAKGEKRILYPTPQPSAPAAVVLPEEKILSGVPEFDTVLVIRNATIAEVRRLNPNVTFK